MALLGSDPPAVAVLDRALGGALSIGTGGVGDGLVRIADARGSVLTPGRGAVRSIGRRLGRADGRAERTELLHAAHTMIVVLAWFQALEERHLPVRLEALELTRRERLALAGAPQVGERGAAFARSLAATDAPSPVPHRPFESVTDQLQRWYEGLSVTFLDFAEGLRVWSTQTETLRGEARRVIRTELPHEAVRQYESLYAQLAKEAPEFGFWTTRIEHRATRTEVRRSLGGVTGLLADLAAQRTHRATASARVTPAAVIACVFLRRGRTRRAGAPQPPRRAGYRRACGEHAGFQCGKRRGERGTVDARNSVIREWT